LRIRIASNEFNALNAFFHHAVDGVLACSTYSDHFDTGEGFGLQISFVRVHVFLLAKGMPILNENAEF
jgi:hypothetical protein